MTAQKRVIILGGGIAGLAAAYELSATPQRRADYDVTMYQKGWRLGGKCASTRGSHPSDPGSLRIEEHGLHVWFGFYFNAFRMIRDCYAELGDPALDIASMFRRCSSTPLMEPPFQGAESVWPLDFPEDDPDVEPGVTSGLPSITEAARRIFKFFTHQVQALVADFEKQAIKPSGIAWLTNTVQVTSFGVEISSVDATLAALFSGAFASPATILPIDSFFSIEELAFIGAFVSDISAKNWGQVRLDILALPPSALRNDLRRTYILADLALAVTNGLRQEALAVLQRGFDALDDRDFREWIAANGAHPESVDSAPVRALYDLVFAYTDGSSSSFASADFAAGTALRCVVRITLGYHGAICYTMNAGMGEAVIAPLYRLLKLRGVHFEFFHRIDRIELDLADRPRRLHFTRQAMTISGLEYRPLAHTAGGLAYWPRQPDFAQLVDGTSLQASGELGMDADDEGWYDEAPLTVDLKSSAGDTAALIVAVSIGGLDRISGDLQTALVAWSDMLATTLTVATQSAQLWMNTDLAGLGYPATAVPAMVAAPEPMDVWADMHQVLAFETWTAGYQPKSVQYLCGPLKGDFSTTDEAIDCVAANTVAWLDVMATSGWASTRSGGTNTFNANFMLGTALKGAERVREQHLRANFQASERYVLSVKGSIAKRLWADTLAVNGLYFAGDWTRNGLNAGCVEAAVMAGLQAAHAQWGESPTTVAGATDTL